MYDNIKSGKKLIFMISQTERIRQLIQLLELAGKAGRPAKSGDEYGLVPLAVLQKLPKRRAGTGKNKLKRQLI